MKLPKHQYYILTGVVLLASLLFFGWKSSAQADDFQTRSESRSIFDFSHTGGSDINASISQQGGDGHPHGHIPAHGRFTRRNGDQSWPPQLKGAKNVRWDPGAEGARVEQQNTASRMERAAAQNQEVQNLLGERYTFIGASPLREKWEKEVTGHRVTFFSYSNNLTIEAIVSNGAVTTIETFDPKDKQPSLRQNEVNEAIRIARKYWQDKGMLKVNELQGFTIQTLKTDDGGGFFDTRMTYVSFHVDETSVPELLTWVDLTHGTVVRAAIDEGGELNEQ